MRCRKRDEQPRKQKQERRGRMTPSPSAQQTTQPQPLLSMRGVNKSFPGVKALSDVDLELYAGEVLALAGENGAGKSTLMKLLSGIYQADSGTIMLNGETLELDGPAAAQGRGSSIIHQEFTLVPDLTVAKNISIGREPRRWGWVDQNQISRRSQAHIEALHLPLQAQQVVGQLSVAQQQMVEIAKALLQQPKVLIMDEPTATLNRQEVELLHNQIGRASCREGGYMRE